MSILVINIIGEGQVQPEQEKVEAIRVFLIPSTKKELRLFLGLMGYYRKLYLPISPLQLHNGPYLQKPGNKDQMDSRVQYCI